MTDSKKKELLGDCGFSKEDYLKHLFRLLEDRLTAPKLSTFEVAKIYACLITLKQGQIIPQMFDAPLPELDPLVDSITNIESVLSDIAITLEGIRERL